MRLGLVGLPVGAGLVNASPDRGQGLWLPGESPVPAGAQDPAHHPELAAQRDLLNRLIGCLHHCLSQRVYYDETTAFLRPRNPISNSLLDSDCASDVFPGVVAAGGPGDGLSCA